MSDCGRAAARFAEPPNGAGARSNPTVWGRRALEPGGSDDDEDRTRSGTARRQLRRNRSHYRASRSDDGTWRRPPRSVDSSTGCSSFPGSSCRRISRTTLRSASGTWSFAAAPISNVDKTATFSATRQTIGSRACVATRVGTTTHLHAEAGQGRGLHRREWCRARSGPTGWADMRAAYEALDDETRARVQDLQAFHSLHYSNGRMGYLPAKRPTGAMRAYGLHDLEVPLRPLVKVHPDTGRPNLLIGRHAHNIVGMDPEESERFLDELNEEACQPPRIYHHQWEPGEAVVWDNRRLMHRGTPFDMTEPRRMWHTRIAGEDESELAVNHVAGGRS